ncbi:MAG TPA: arylsulfotransferase family protein [Polyangiaceae bacterium]|nr:arylsulfotransferase family protein [Polyangiaceae bacterium]
MSLGAGGTMISMAGTGAGGSGATPTSGGSGGTGPVPNGGMAGSSAPMAGRGGSSMGGASGGTPGAPLAGMAGMSAAGSGSVSVGSCTFNVTASVSDKITSVGLVDWSVDRPGLDSASIEFGLDTSYGSSAPVDLKAANYHTLLLGMKYGHSYHFKVIAQAGSERCESADYTLQTGPLPNGLPKPTLTTMAADKVFGGFTISERWGANKMGPSFIFDKDFDYVWMYPGEDDVIRTRMSFDGKAMWLRNTAQTDGTGVVRRVSMDGLKEDRWELPHTTHDLAVIPDGHVGLVGHASSGCDEILDFNPDDGTLTSLFNAKEAHGNTMCHVNYLAYFAGDDSFVFSDYDASSLIKITRHGDFVWGLNGDASTISGTSWVREHGVHILAPDDLIVFSNGDGAAQKSLVFELKLDLAAKTATELWRYDADQNTTFGGDVQKLANGNLLVTYSSSGVIQELDPSRNVVQQATFDIGSALAYTERRLSLYGGPPPKIYE